MQYNQDKNLDAVEFTHSGSRVLFSWVRGERTISMALKNGSSKPTVPKQFTRTLNYIWNSNNLFLSYKSKVFACLALTLQHHKYVSLFIHRHQGELQPGALHSNRPGNQMPGALDQKGTLNHYDSLYFQKCFWILE